MRILAIDPGLRNMGWAVLETANLLQYGLIKAQSAHKDEPWVKRALRASGEVGGLIDEWRPERLACEMPVELQSYKGRAALASGAVRKLAFLVGVIGGLARARGINFTIYEPMQWKGNVPKEITRKRVLRRYPDVPPDTDHNIIDAIGIGMHHIEKIRRSNS